MIPRPIPIATIRCKTDIESDQSSRKMPISAHRIATPTAASAVDHRTLARLRRSEDNCERNTLRRAIVAKNQRFVAMNCFEIIAFEVSRQVNQFPYQPFAEHQGYDQPETQPRAPQRDHTGIRLAADVKLNL